jgi:hypothetical protein
MALFIMEVFMEEEKVTVIIEETISQEFKINKSDIDRVKELYDSGKLVVTLGNVTSVCYAIKEENSNFIQIR